jgi:hypothetical protein
MNNNTETQIAKATAAQYVRETAKAQVALDRKRSGFAAVNEGVSDPEIEAFVRRERERLEFCKAKSKEWADKAYALASAGIERL